MARIIAGLCDFRRSVSSLGGLALLFVGIAGAVLWTLLGILVSLSTETPETFLREWALLQGPPLLTLGLCLSLISVGGRLESLATALECPQHFTELRRRTRLMFGLFVTLVGSSSLISLGFPATGTVLVFMWLTCLLICFMASLATEHAARLLVFSSKLASCPLKLQPYSPADTPGLRKFAEYVAYFGLVSTVGYCFAFAGTLGGNWTANPDHVRVVTYFWPLIYVPLCLATLAYPHISIYRLVRDTKDRTIRSLQLKMVVLTNQDAAISSEDIEHLNALADLISKIEDTPNYPKNISLIGTLALTGLVNLGSLLIPKEALAQVLRHAIGF